MHNRIPLARGLGSSAAATVAGVVAGNALLGDPLSQADLLRLASEVEGHPDNAAAALLGGFTVSARTPDGVEAVRFDAPRDLRRSSSSPSCVSRRRRCARRSPRRCRSRTPWRTSARSAWASPGLAAGRHDLLRYLTVDRIHEPYRASVYPQLPQMIEAAREAGALGACLSGAGSSILAFVDSMAGITRIEGAFAAAAADTDLPGRIEVVEPRNAGAKVVKLV